MIKLLLLEFLHEVLKLKRLVIETLGEILLERVLDFGDVQVLLVFEEFKFVIECFFQGCHLLLSLDEFAFLKVLILTLSLELLVPIEAVWRQFLNREFVDILIGFT